MWARCELQGSVECFWVDQFSVGALEVRHKLYGLAGADCCTDLLRAHPSWYCCISRVPWPSTRAEISPCYADGAVLAIVPRVPGAGGGALEPVNVGKGHPAAHYKIGICGYIDCAINRF